MSNTTRSIVVLIAAALLIGVAVYALQNRGGVVSNPVTCTADAKVCPDGSSVGRIGPTCEFEACPDTKTTTPDTTTGGTATTTTTYYTTSDNNSGGNVIWVDQPVNQNQYQYQNQNQYYNYNNGVDYLYSNNYQQNSNQCGESNVTCQSGYYPICSVGIWYCAQN